VLVSLGQGAYGFLHLSLQEYLAARHVQDRLVKEQALLTELASHFGETWWREVLLLAVGLDNPSLFEPLMEELSEQQLLHKDAALADDCLRDALAKTPAPVVRALGAGLGKWEERYAALRLLDRLPGWEAVEVGDGRRGREVVEALAGKKGEREQVRGMASELLGGRVAVAPEVRVEEPRPGEERLHPVDGSVLVYVPGGEYVLGAEDLEGLGLKAEWAEWSKPVHRVRLSPFWIGKYPVTHEQYARFLEASPGTREPEYWEDKQFNQPRQPVVGMSLEEAWAYCRWAGLALPSEAQWEAAARGTDQRRYPWGNQEPSPERANFGGREGRTTPVGAYPAGAGPFGTLDQAGNVWEWCADGWDEKAYRGRDGKLDPVARPPEGEAAFAALRGGSWAHPARSLAAAIRFRDWLGYRDQGFGFRCVLSSVSEHG
jgi:formylglycine-generating enzyme required for sulfatase activity